MLDPGYWDLRIQHQNAAMLGMLMLDLLSPLLYIQYLTQVWWLAQFAHTACVFVT